MAVMTNPSPRNTAFIKDTVRIYLSTMRQEPLQIALSSLLPISAILTTVIAPFFASKVLAGIVSGANVYPDFVIFALAGIVGITANGVGITSNMRMQARTMKRLHELVLERILQRSVGYYTNKIGGKLVSDVLEFIASFSVLVTSLSIKGLGLAAVIVTGIIVITVNSLQLGLFVFVLLTLITVWTVIDNKRRTAFRTRRIALTRELTGHLSDTIVNGVTVKTFAREADELTRSNELAERLARMRERDWVRTTFGETQRVGAIVIMQIMLILLVIRLVENDPALLATGIFAFTYTLSITNRFFEINTIIRQADESLLNAAPMTQMLLEDIEVTDTENATELQSKNGEIVFKNVHFRYADSKHSHDDVFSDLNLAVKSGEKVGLVGHSGSGKTTLTRLLLRFDDIQEGAITIDGQNIAAVTQVSLRRAIAYVPQEPLLFHRSIEENIAYGKPGATQEEIEKAAHLAHATEFINKLPDGYGTVVGERGVKLSGGQRQRVAIARAILKDAPVLVLDEATSALDSESEELIQKALWELMKNRTAIVVAHRFSTIQRMDRIVVLDKGKIIEQGSHKELLAKKGAYAKLWAHQSGGFIDE